MKKHLILLFTLTATMLLAHSQDKEEKPARTTEDVQSGGKKGFDKSKLFLGGNFGMSFGDYTLINVSPQLGYRFNQYLATGVGINFQYASLKQRDIYGDPLYKTSQDVVGLNIFGRVYPFRQMILQVQPELNYIFGKQKYFGPPSQTTKLDASIVPSLLLGGGAVFPAGNSAFIASVFYDILQRPNSPYSNRPFFNFGYDFGF